MERTNILHSTEVHTCYSHSLVDYCHDTNSKFVVEFAVEIEVEVEVEVEDKLGHCIA